jgi:hypothetical protein
VVRHKVCKIESTTTYPCPFHRDGKLLSISLTDALGCDRCHHIFVVRPDGYTLDQVSSPYPNKQSWYWTGSAWHPVHTPLYGQGCRGFIIFFAILFVIAVVLIAVLLLQSPR